MSSLQLHEDHPTRREINGPRPTPLKINKDSHFIHKPSSSIASIASSSLAIAAAAKQSQQQHHQQRHPVIIYTLSPKIIHTQPSDFMALVQKLTGMSRSDDPPKEISSSDGHRSPTSSSVVADDNHGRAEMGPTASTSVSSVLDAPNSFLSEMPLFTPNASGFFCSPRMLNRYSDSGYSPSNMGRSISPTIIEAMKTLPEY